MSVAKNLFAGRILEDSLFPYPRLREKDREVLGMMVEAIDQFLEPKHQDFKRWDRDAAQPEEFIQGLRDLGLFGLIIPEEHGGLGLSNAGYARVLSQTSSHDSSVSLTIGAHSSIGMKGILLFGTAEQRARYLPKLASGEMIAAFCLTESGAGSDAASIRTRARKKRRRHVDAQRRKNLDHQRRNRRPIHGVRAHGVRCRQDHGVFGRGGLAGSESRTARGQDGNPCLLDDHGELRRRESSAGECTGRGGQGFQGGDGHFEQRAYRLRGRCGGRDEILDRARHSSRRRHASSSDSRLPSLDWCAKKLPK